MSTVSVRTDVRIEPKAQGKGRTFRATYLASAIADSLWSGGTTDTGDVERPVFAVFAGSDAELRPFVANLMLGRRALTQDGYYRRRARGFEFLRSAGYRYTWQREDEGSLVTVYLPELFLMDPGMVDPKVARFVLLPPKHWADGQKIETAAIVKHAKRLPLVKQVNAPPKEEWRRERWTPEDAPLSEEKLAALVPTAYLFAAFLDRRTRAPLVADGRFYLQLMLACLKAGYASWSCGDRHSYGERPFGQNAALKFETYGTDDAGLLPGLAFEAQHDVLEPLLADEVGLFFELTKGGR